MISPDTRERASAPAMVIISYEVLPLDGSPSDPIGRRRWTLSRYRWLVRDRWGMGRPLLRLRSRGREARGVLLWATERQTAWPGDTARWPIGGRGVDARQLNPVRVGRGRPSAPGLTPAPTLGPSFGGFFECGDHADYPRPRSATGRPSEHSRIQLPRRQGTVPLTSRCAPERAGSRTRRRR